MPEVSFEEVQKEIDKLRREIENKPDKPESKEPVKLALPEDAPEYTEFVSEEEQARKNFLDEVKKLKYEFQDWYKEQYENELEFNPPVIDNELKQGATIEVNIEEGTGKNGIVKINDYLLFVEKCKKGMKVTAKVIWLDQNSKTGWLRPVDKIIE